MLHLTIDFDPLLLPQHDTDHLILFFSSLIISVAIIQPDPPLLGRQHGTGAAPAVSGRSRSGRSCTDEGGRRSCLA